MTHRYPELGGLGKALSPRNAVLDGEIVALDDGGRPSFELLQQRMHVENASTIRRLAQEIPAIYMAFDLLWLDGDSVLERSYDERRDSCSRSSSPLRRGKSRRTKWATVRRRSRSVERFGLEGVVAKRRDSPYEPGRRTRTWLKLKNTTEQEFVVGGWMPGERGRTGTVGSLLIGYYEDLEVRTLRYAARCRERATRIATSIFSTGSSPNIARDTSPFAAGTPPKTARFLDPVLVVQVKFSEWTHSGGVRAPVFMGYRDDIDPASVVREVPALTNATPASRHRGSTGSAGDGQLSVVLDRHASLLPTDRDQHLAVVVVSVAVGVLDARYGRRPRHLLGRVLEHRDVADRLTRLEIVGLDEAAHRFRGGAGGHAAGQIFGVFAQVLRLFGHVVDRIVDVVVSPARHQAQHRHGHEDTTHQTPHAKKMPIERNEQTHTEQTTHAPG